MSAQVSILDHPATCDGGKWSCDNHTVRDWLVARATEIGDSPSIPDLDEYLALDAARTIGATVTKHSDKPASAGDRVY